MPILIIYLTVLISLVVYPDVCLKVSQSLLMKRIPTVVMMFSVLVVSRPKNITFFLLIRLENHFHMFADYPPCCQTGFHVCVFSIMAFILPRFYKTFLKVYELLYSCPMNSFCHLTCISVLTSL